MAAHIGGRYIRRVGAGACVSGGADCVHYTVHTGVPTSRFLPISFVGGDVETKISDSVFIYRRRAHVGLIQGGEHI